MRFLLIFIVGITFSPVPKEKPVEPEKRRLYGIKLVDCNPINFNQGGM